MGIGLQPQVTAPGHNCNRCGDCCERILLHSLLPKRKLGDELLDMLEFVGIEGKCYLYRCKNYNKQNGRCLIYQKRPQTCKDHFCEKAR